MLGWIVLFSILGSVFSMAGGLFLLWKTEFAKRISLFLISFSAGVLLGVAFLDLLPESFEGIGDIHTVSIIVLITIATLFTVERFLWWFHHHRFQAEEHHHEHKAHVVNKAHAYLLLTGDALHNFIDGIVIAAAFLIDFRLGVGVSMGIIAHELPQEIADFSIMITAGFTKMKTFVLNLGAALMTVLGAVLAYFVLVELTHITPYLLAIGMGVFVYIALSDLIPAIHHDSEHKYDVVHFVLFALGIMLIFFIGASAHTHVGEDDIHSEEEHGEIHIEEEEEDHLEEETH